MEQVRLPFYHWVWPLTLVVALTLALAAVDLAAARAPAMSHVTARASAGRGAALLAGAAVVAVLVPVAVTPALDRPSDELPASGTFTPRWAIDALADQVMAVDGGTGPPEPVVIVPVGGNVFAGTDAALAMRLAERGVDIRWTLGLRDFVADEHVVDLAAVGSVVVVAAEGIGDPSPDDIPGEQVGVLSLVDGLDRDDHTRLVAAFAGVSVDDLAYRPS